MNSRGELMIAAMRREPAERIPTMPQICHDLPVRLYAGEHAPGEDWLDGMRRCVEDPAVIYDLVIRLVQQVGCDALRLFVKPEPMRVARDRDELIVLDQETGNRIGRIDSHGGGALVPDRKPAPVESLEEYRARLELLRSEFTDEKMALLRETRGAHPRSVRGLGSGRDHDEHVHRAARTRTGDGRLLRAA